MKKIDVIGKTHLYLFALKDIKEGEEIAYDYGGDDCPWRTLYASDLSLVFPCCEIFSFLMLCPTEEQHC